MPSDLRDLLPLSPRVFSVLLALADGGQHGYGIARAIETQSDGAVRITSGTLYPIIRQMLMDGWIVEIDDEDPRRRTYRLTPRGRRVAQAEAARLADLVRIARSCKLLPSGA
jgi:DNA-binding PadR family transcriptional regulator